jgi:carboxymethylenebutenolidase
LQVADTRIKRYADWTVRHELSDIVLLKLLESKLPLSTQGPGGAVPTISRTPQIGGKIHCYFGGQDALIPQHRVESIRNALETAGIDHEVHVYEAADHGFHCDQRATYHEESAKDAWRRTFELFGSTLRG